MISLFKNSIYISDKIMDFLTMLLYASFVIFSNDSMGAVYMTFLILSIYIIHIGKYGLQIPKRFGSFHKYMLWFAIYCFLSSLWAQNPDYAIEKGVTIIELLISFTFLYIVFSKYTIDRLLSIVMWSGYLLAIYTIVFVGTDNLQDILNSGERMENSYANVNAIGMACSTSILLTYHLWKKRTNIVDAVMCIPCLIIVASTGSRKALVLLLLGLFMLTILNTKSKKYEKKKILVILLSILGVLTIIYIVAKSGVFGVTIERMEGMIASFTGIGDIDSSSLKRIIYRELGLNQFKETPIIGMGIGNPRILAQKYTGNDCYLHCNYVELAAGGGIIGVLLYYWIYVKLLKEEFRIGKKESSALIVLVLIILNLILDYGRVSYYSKETYFMLAIFCIHYETMKKKQISLTNQRTI